jgi:NAD(P)-dependent dehydrogenase (short-subunit alcohol dehydrogenase family)
MWKDKVVIITGSTQGIGFKTAEILLAKGARVVLNSRRPEKLIEALRDLSQYNTNVVGLAGDVSDYEFCLALKEFTLQHYHKIDVLINNAGLASSGQLGDSTPEGIRKVLDVNVLGSVLPTMACLEELRKSKGSVLFISSVAGVLGLPGHSAYSASKRAMVSYAESLKNELFDFNVFVGVNYPGFTENDPNKIIVKGDGSEHVLDKRTDVKLQSTTSTAMNLIRQLEKQKFRSYSSASAYFIQLIYRFFPALSLGILRFKRKRIMN